MFNFYKYHGSGNDFIIADNRNLSISHDLNNWFKLLCDRHLGIGADGLMLLEPSHDLDFEMFYVNADGNPGSMCGNGGRCMVAFAKKLGIVTDHACFLAADGVHYAKISESGWVELEMGSPSIIQTFEDLYILQTGSPHIVKWVTHLDKVDVFNEGRVLRHHNRFVPMGINVNFAEKISENLVRVRTYERGVENETLSCGTGVTAVALVLAHLENDSGHIEKTVETSGGVLTVSFNRSSEGNIENLILKGPTEWIYQGTWVDGK